MCFDNDEYAEFSNSGIVTARKDHKCDWCRKPILKGQQYQHNSGKFDGSFFSTKICNPCFQDTMTIVRHEIDEGCRWHEAWPGTRFAYVDFLPPRATEIVDLRAARAALDEYWMNRQKRKTQEQHAIKATS